jgi:hypothetical protein
VPQWHPTTDYKQFRQHGANLPFEKILLPTLKHWYAYQMIYPWSLFFVKASILALYHRIFTQTKLRYWIYAVTIFVTIYTVVVFFVNVSYCTEKCKPRADNGRLSNVGLIRRRHGRQLFLKAVTTCRQLTSRLRPSTF